MGLKRSYMPPRPTPWTDWGRLLILSLLVFLASACASGEAPQLRATMVPRLAPWAEGWLTGQPCAPPCWEGITPGVTSIDEALARVRQLGTNHVLYRPTIKYPTILWGWDHGGFGQIGTHAGVITEIYPGYELEYRLGDIVARFGEPSHSLTYATVMEGQSTYLLKLYFVSQGIVLSTTWSHPFMVTADLPMSGVGFVASGPAGFAAANYRLEQMQPWRGYEEISFPTPK